MGATLAPTWVPAVPEAWPSRDAKLALGMWASGLLASWVASTAGTSVKSILVQHLSPWIKSARGHERARALVLGACLLQFFLEHLHVSVSTGLQTLSQSILWAP